MLEQGAMLVHCRTMWVLVSSRSFCKRGYYVITDDVKNGTIAAKASRG